MPSGHTKGRQEDTAWGATGGPVFRLPKRPPLNTREVSIHISRFPPEWFKIEEVQHYGGAAVTRRELRSLGSAGGEGRVQAEAGAEVVMPWLSLRCAEKVVSAVSQLQE